MKLLNILSVLALGVLLGGCHTWALQPVDNNIANDWVQMPYEGDNARVWSFDGNGELTLTVDGEQIYFYEEASDRQDGTILPKPTTTYAVFSDDFGRWLQFGNLVLTDAKGTENYGYLHQTDKIRYLLVNARKDYLYLASIDAEGRRSNEQLEFVTAASLDL